MKINSNTVKFAIIPFTILSLGLSFFSINLFKSENAQAAFPVPVITPSQSYSLVLNKGINFILSDDSTTNSSLTSTKFVYNQNGKVQTIPKNLSNLAFIGDFDGDKSVELLDQIVLPDGKYERSIQSFKTNKKTVINAELSDKSWQIKGVNDMDGDGKDDLIWRNYTNGQNLVWFMDGTNLRYSQSLYTVTQNIWDIKAVGDIDGDGKGDVVWRNQETGDTHIWTYKNGQMKSTSLMLVADKNWDVIGIADYNNDNRGDLIWYNTNTAAVAYWNIEPSKMDSLVDYAEFGDLKKIKNTVQTQYPKSKEIYKIVRVYNQK